MSSAEEIAASPDSSRRGGEDAREQRARVPARISEELNPLAERWQAALVESNAAFYESLQELIQRYCTLIEYGLHKSTGRIRRKKTRVPSDIPPDVMLAGLRDWKQRLDAQSPLETFTDAMAPHIGPLPPVLHEVQAAERFVLQEDDTGVLRLSKSLKIAAYKSQKQVYTAARGVLPQLRAPQWKQRIPLRALVEAHQTALLRRCLAEKKHHVALSEALSEACASYIDRFIASVAAGLRQQETEAGELSAAEAFHDALQQLASRTERYRKAEAERMVGYVQLQLRQLYRQCARADTIELPRRHFSQAAIQRNRAQVRQEYQRYKSAMSRDAALFLDELKLKQGLYDLGRIWYAQMQGVHTRLHRLFKSDEGFSGIIGQARESYQKICEKYAIPATARRSDGRLILRITNLREILQRLLMPESGREIPPDEQADISAEELHALPAYAPQIQALQPEETLIEELSSAVLFQGNELPARLSYHESRKADSEHGRPETEAAHIELREEVTAYLRGVLLRKLSGLPGQIRQECSKLQESWLEMSEMISINLSSAIDVVEDREEDKYRIKASELAEETLRRGGERLQELGTAAGSAHQKLRQQFDAAAGESLQFLLDVALEGNYAQLKWKSRSLKVEETALGWKSKAVMYWSRFRDTAAVLQRFSGQKYRSSAGWIQQSVGMAKTGDEASIQTDAAQFLAETDRIVARLPLIYRRLYRNEPVEHKRFLVGRSAQLASLRKAWADWQARYYSNFIAIGERGSGKTSILDIGLQQLGLPEEQPVIRGSLRHTIYTETELLMHLCQLFGYEPQTDKAAFIERLRQRKDQPVVVWEGFQNLYLRHLGGFEALEAFLLIISQTGRQVFWALSCSRYAWSYLDKIFRVGEYFIYKCTTDELTEAEIRDVIMSRHPISGYELEFVAGDREQSSRSYKKLLNDYQARQDYLDKRYFAELYKVAEGNVSIALLYWLRSVLIEDDTTIKITPLSETLRQIGDNLSEDAIFVLAFILLHDDLTPPQLALAFHISEQESQLLLSRLAAKSLLSAGEDGRYYLNHLLYRHITRILKTKNIIH